VAFQNTVSDFAKFKSRFKPLTQPNLFMIKFRIFLTSAFALLVGSTFLEGQGTGGLTKDLLTPPQNAPYSFKPIASAETAPDAQGFIPLWLILEPITIGNQQTENASKAAAKTEYFPNQLTILPHDGDKVTVGSNELAWHAVETANYNVNLYYFATAHNKTSANALFWAVAVINCPEEIPNVRLAVGSNASSIWWVDGKEVVGIYGDIQTVVDDGVSGRLTLKKGANVIRGAIINGSGASDFCARFLDAQDKPIKSLTVSVGEIAK
jgi:hypothetical protein